MENCVLLHRRKAASHPIGFAESRFAVFVHGGFIFAVEGNDRIGNGLSFPIRHRHAVSQRFSAQDRIIARRYFQNQFIAFFDYRNRIRCQRRSVMEKDNAVLSSGEGKIFPFIGEIAVFQCNLGRFQYPHRGAEKQHRRPFGGNAAF